jgi:hypothetical protein
MSTLIYCIAAPTFAFGSASGVAPSPPPDDALVAVAGGPARV